MPFKRPGSDKWWIGPLKAGVVVVPRMSTGQTSKAIAVAIEKSLKSAAVTGFADLVARVAAKDLPVIELYTAHLEGTDALVRLRERASDPLLIDLIRGKPDAKGVRRGGLLRRLADRRHRDGLETILALAPDDARLSYLRSPKTLGELYDRAIAGEDQGDVPRLANSVRRSVHQAAAALLRKELGRGAMMAVMTEVEKPSANDERSAMLSLEEIERALAAADEEFQPVLGVFLTTGIDRSPMLAGIAADYDEAQGILQVRDTKTAARARTLLLREEPVLENAEYWLRQLVAGKRPDERLVPFTRRQIQIRWEAVRKAIGRKDVRLKDLRGTFATYYLTAGGDPRNLQQILGHSTMAMTLRYLRRLPAGNRERLKAAAKTAGQWRGRIRLARAGEK